MSRRLSRNTTFDWLAILAVIVVVQLAELMLLQRKYDIFTGGFLQPYSYQPGLFTE